MSKIKIYVVMCDTPRTDLDNVDSAWLDKIHADGRRDYLNRTDTYNTWHTEVLKVERTGR